VSGSYVNAGVYGGSSGGFAWYNKVYRSRCRKWRKHWFGAGFL